MGIEDNIANLMDYFESVVVYSLSGERETTYMEYVQIPFFRFMNSCSSIKFLN